MILPSDWGQGKIAHCMRLTVSLVMQMTLITEIPDKQAMSGMRLTSRQRSVYENVYEIDQSGGILYSLNR